MLKILKCINLELSSGPFAYTQMLEASSINVCIEDLASCEESQETTVVAI